EPRARTRHAPPDGSTPPLRHEEPPSRNTGSPRAPRARAAATASSPPVTRDRAAESEYWHRVGGMSIGDDHSRSHLWGGPFRPAVGPTTSIRTASAGLHAWPARRTADRRARDRA